MTFDFARERGSTHKIGQLNPTKRYGIAAEVSSEERAYVGGLILMGLSHCM
jgi:hypothetical protein